MSINANSIAAFESHTGIAHKTTTPDPQQVSKSTMTSSATVPQVSEPSTPATASPIPGDGINTKFKDASTSPPTSVVSSSRSSETDGTRQFKTTEPKPFRSPRDPAYEFGKVETGYALTTQIQTLEQEMKKAKRMIANRESARADSKKYKNLPRVIHAKNATDPHVCAPPSQTPTTTTTPNAPKPRTVIYQSTGIQTLPVGNNDTFRKCYGRDQRLGESGAAGRGRYTSVDDDPYELRYGDAFVAMISDAATKSTDSGFQIMDYTFREVFLRNAKMKAASNAAKVKDIAEDEGYRIFAETEDKMIVHSQQIPPVIGIKMKHDGTVDKDALTAPIAPNLLYEEIHPSVIPSIGETAGLSHSSSSAPPVSVPKEDLQPIPVFCPIYGSESEIDYSDDDDGDKEAYAKKAEEFAVKSTFDESSESNSSRVRLLPGRQTKKAEVLSTVITPNATETTPTAPTPGSKKRKAVDEPSEPSTKNPDSIEGTTSKRARLAEQTPTSDKNVQRQSTPVKKTIQKRDFSRTGPNVTAQPKATPPFQPPPESTLIVKPPEGGPTYTKDNPRFGPAKGVTNEATPKLAEAAKPTAKVSVAKETFANARASKLPTRIKERQSLAPRRTTPAPLPAPITLPAPTPAAAAKVITTAAPPSRKRAREDSSAISKDTKISILGQAKRAQAQSPEEGELHIRGVASAQAQRTERKKLPPRHGTGAYVPPHLREGVQRKDAGRFDSREEGKSRDDGEDYMRKKRKS